MHDGVEQVENPGARANKPEPKAARLCGPAQRVRAGPHGVTRIPLHVGRPTSLPPQGRQVGAVPEPPCSHITSVFGFGLYPIPSSRLRLRPLGVYAPLVMNSLDGSTA